ncbi:MAG: cyclase family protein [Tissierellia bacterium]|nr:cyclase family protein [Tissierellia bacterium]
MYKLWNALNKFKDNCEIVDLSHPVAPESPLWTGFEPIRERVVYNFKEHKFLAKEYTLASQNSTHIDAPGHFYEPGILLHELDINDMILPLIVIDKSKEASENPDYTISPEDIIEWEKEYGEIIEGSFVALRTDWSQRKENFNNVDEEGVAHYPGWSIEACEYLIDKRKVKAIGHETSDTDASCLTLKTGWLDVETYVLSKGIYQVELLKDLYKMPATGSIILVSYPNVIDAPGFTARCLGIKLK